MAIKHLSLRLNETEYAHLKRLSETCGLKLEPTIRSLIMGADLKPRPPEVYAELLRQVSAIGNNINQIARVANGTGRVRQTEIDALQDMLSEVWRLVKAL